jgi:hypothetical protein
LSGASKLAGALRMFLADGQTILQRNGVLSGDTLEGTQILGF